MSAHLNRFYLATLFVFFWATSAYGQGQTQNEEFTLEPSDGVANQFFGWNVALDGDFAVVGAPRERRNNNEIRDQGAAYVYRRHSAIEPCPGSVAWCEEAKLTPQFTDETFLRVRLGWNVAISGDTVIAGAPFDGQRDPDPGLDARDTGAAFIWRRCAPQTWCFEGKLTASDGATLDRFGNNVAISGDTAFIGSSPGTVGAVYVFTRSGSTWTETAKLTPPTNDPFQRFSSGLAVSGDTLLVGANGDSSRAGAAYVFVRTGGVWLQQAKLLASDRQASDGFGSGVALSGDTAVIAGPQQINGVCENGAAYVFTRSGSVWQEQKKFLSPSGVAEDCFGFAVALSGNTLIIPADLESVPGPDAGAAYVYRGAGANWSTPTRIAPAISLGPDAFGWSVGLDGETAVLSAPVSFRNRQDRPGAAYIFSFGPGETGVNLLNNAGFEDGPGTDPQDPSDLNNVLGWQNAGSAMVGFPATGAAEGIYAAEVSVVDPANNVIGFILQRKFLNRFLTARPGQEFYASARVLRETAPSGPSNGLLGLAFYDGFGNVIDDMAPASISKGSIGDCPFPAINASSAADVGSVVLNEWNQLQSQGIAAGAPGSENPILIDCMEKVPTDAVEVGLFLFNINLTGAAAPIWFDDVTLVRLDPDNDGDRLENGVDSDPLNSSAEFSDGTTFGIVDEDINGILGIDDEPAPDGVRIMADPGSGAPARVLVCDESAVLTVNPGNELVVTCGSVVVAVEAGPAVTMEIVLNGEPATVNVPAENTVTFEPEASTVSVESTATNPEPVILEVGGAVVPISPGAAFTLVPFAEFSAAAEFDDDELEIEGRFTLGADSNGIYPPTEDTTVGVGTSIVSIPAGSFSDEGDGEFEFEGTVAGVELEIEMESSDGMTYHLEVEFESQHQNGPGPVQVELTIGDDRGMVLAGEVDDEDDEDDD